MKSKTAIQIEFQQVIRQAQTLENCADDLQEIRRQIDGLIENLGSGWVGESANQYFLKCKELSSKMNVSRMNLDNMAAVIRKSAHIYRDAELRAIELVENM